MKKNEMVFDNVSVYKTLYEKEEGRYRYGLVKVESKKLRPFIGKKVRVKVVFE